MRIYRRAMTGYRQLARNRDFTVLWVGETISELGNRTSAFAYPLVALALTGSAGTAALVQAAYFGGIVAALLPAGALVDRVHRGRLLRAVSLAGFTVYAALATTLAAGALPAAGLVLGALVAGVLAGVYEPAQVSAVRSVVTTDDLPAALAQNQARGHVAGLAGAPLGGVLLGLGRWVPFALDAATYLVSFLTLGRIRTDLAPAARREGRLMEGARREVVAGARYVARHPVMRVLAVWSALGNLVVNGLLFVVLVRMAEAGHSPAAIGAAMAVVGAAGILGAAIAPAVIDRTRTGRLTVAVGWSCAVPLVPLVWWATPATAAACVGALVLLNPIGNAGIGAYRMSLTPPELQGRVAATTAFLSWSLMPFAPLLGGALLAAYGGSAATAALLGGCLLTALVITCSRSVRGVPRPREWATAS
ncbi:putative MFS family arabinose efflux permease [Nocardioides zeae]|uniref:MFS family arabinose efflux permease n=2 Tax=Nocardioides zeae TaxID=1457234 RepID=A0AAJ1U1Q4_9ACTN|nr:putative MFS family arabinose efflux permease [Nocardioides zeae]